MLKDFNQFLLENDQEMLTKLEDLVNNKITCSIYYKGERIGDILDGIRFIEPYCVGIGNDKQYLLRAWLIKGVSKTGKIDPRVVPGWRLFKINRIRTITPTLDKIEVPKKGYNIEDSAMKEILFTSNF